MDDEVLRSIRAAYASLAGGDVDTFSQVLDPEVHWRGRTKGVLRKRHPY
jgi:hypothetical protein